jgi:hypothetical protein
MHSKLTALCAAGLALALAAPLHAQKSGQAAPVPDAASISVPDLTFQPAAGDAKDYDKYFYFHRDDTDFATAYADIQECDGYSQGFGFMGGDASSAMAPYMASPAGAVGGMLGMALSDATFGSAVRRELRRANMRTCMAFKEYRAYGLPKELWQKFNFEEGLTRLDEERRTALLQKQAKVASGPKPQQGEIAS